MPLNILSHSVVKETTIQHGQLTGCRATSSPCPPLPQDFLWAGNGIFRSVTRTEFRAVALYHRVLTPGLIELSPQFQLLVSPVPREKVKDIIDEIRRYPDLEQLFYLYWRGECWEVFKPEQECTPYSCVCLDPYPEPAAIEIHSHGYANAFFSKTDNREETGCRISTVFGRTNRQLEVTSRVCIHGLFLNIDSNRIYQDINHYCHHVTDF
ncbi:hypothetical protein C7B62_08600 [Pleurocapsa sp. CCALA 161]|nr:hypothetical protein C7B62_08600 [Pleurocapsa sp. CCALA 161]